MSNPKIKKVNEIIAKVIDANVSDLSPETSLESLGVDSLDAIALIMEIEKEFSVSISEEMLAQVTTLGDIYDCLDICDELPNDDDVEHRQFVDFFGRWSADISNTLSRYDIFYRECIDRVFAAKSPTVKSEYLFLSAWITLEQMLEIEVREFEIESIIKLRERGSDRIGDALRIWSDEPTFTLVQKMYDLWEEDFETTLDAINQKEIADTTYVNSYLRADYLTYLWHKNAAQCLRFHFAFADTLTPAEYMDRLKKIYGNFSPHNFAYVDSDDPLRQLWLWVCKELALRHAQSIGCHHDDMLAFKYASTAADEGDASVWMHLASHYCDVGDAEHARQCLDTIMEIDDDDSQYRMWATDMMKCYGLDTQIYKEVEEKTDDSAAPTDESFSESEHTYKQILMDLLSDDVEITPRERKLLDCLRTALNISFERACEIEESLLLIDNSDKKDKNQPES